MGKKLSVLDWLFVGTLLVIFGGIVLQGLISVGFSTLFPDQSLIFKAWKEILMGIALLFGVVILTTRKQWAVTNDKLIYYIALFAGLNVLMIPLFQTGTEAVVAGLLINLRFFLFFVLVFIAIKLYPQFYKTFLKVFLGGALVVVGFAILQVTVLPNDFLKVFGYNETTIMPYLTVDQNEAYVRINSTLRGPNPLGAYSAIVLAVVVSAWLWRPRKFTQREAIWAGVLSAGAVVALWASYSRSAALAAVIAVGIVVMVTYGRRIPKAVWFGVLAGAIVLTGSLVALRDTQFVSQVILHEDPHEANDVNSNDGHVASLADGLQRMSVQPLGAGIGSTGSASILSEKDTVIIENYYLFVAHETGWLGLAIFLLINYVVLRRLWARRASWLALGVFAVGIGLAVAALFLPIWVDDTTAIIWWGLAGVALAVPVAKTVRKQTQAKGKAQTKARRKPA